MNSQQTHVENSEITASPGRLTRENLFVLYEQRKLNWWQRRSNLEKSLISVFLICIFIICFLFAFLFLLYSKYGFAIRYAQPLNKLLSEISKIDKTVILDHLRKTQMCYTPGCVKTASHILQSIDTSVDPCKNFYEFSCGNWIRKADIPEDETEVTNFDELSFQLGRNVRKILEQDLPHLRNDSTFGVVHDLWNKCINDTEVEENGDQEFKNFLWNQIGNPFTDVDKSENVPLDLVSIYEQIWRRGYPMNQLFSIELIMDFNNQSRNMILIAPPSFSIPSHYLISTGNSSTSRQYALTKLIARAFRLFGQEPKEAESDGHDLLEFERRMAMLGHATQNGKQKSGDPYENLHRLTLGQLSLLTPGFPWSKLVGLLLPDQESMPESTQIMVYNQDYILGLPNLLKTTPSLVVRKYLIWRLTKSVMWLLDSRWTRLAQWYRRSVYGVNEKPDRWSFCLSLLNSQLSPLIGALYLRRFNTEYQRAEVQQLVSTVHQQLQSSIRQQEWLDETSREAALQRASQMRFLIGYPSQLLDTQALNQYFPQLKPSFNSTFFELMLDTTIWHRQLIPLKLNRLRRQTEWLRYSHVLTVNAFYARFDNLVFLPLGILGDHFYLPDRPAYANLASVGFIAGHEMLHAFDRPCSGNKRTATGRWCTAETAKNLESRAGCVRDYYGLMRKQEGLPVAGDRTLVENIADLAGLKISWRALQSIASQRMQPLLPGLQNYTYEQLFFISYAMNWCRKARPSTLRINVELDNHSTYKYRVIGVLSNSREFAHAFHCGRDTPMNPPDKCEIW